MGGFVSDNQNEKISPASPRPMKLDPWTKKTLAYTMIGAVVVFGALGFGIDRSRKSTKNKNPICAEVAEELTGDPKIDRKTCDKISETVNFIKKREKEEERANTWKDRKSKSIAKDFGVDDYKKVQRVIQQKMNKKPNQRTVKGMQMRVK